MDWEQIIVVCYCVAELTSGEHIIMLLCKGSQPLQMCLCVLYLGVGLGVQFCRDRPGSAPRCTDPNIPDTVASIEWNYLISYYSGCISNFLATCVLARLDLDTLGIVLIDFRLEMIVVSIKGSSCT